MGLIEIKIKCEEIHDGEVKPHGTGARVLVPLRWVGRKVKVILLPKGA